ncbi:Uncharacterised protein [Chlamydia trachomatis]|nr:Uncharacterised protein [Chlamydia trachomatis]
MLVHHADPGGDRVAGPLEDDGRPVDEDLPLVGLVESVEDVHERRFSGAVLSEEGVNPSFLDGEVNVVVRDQGPEALRNPPEFQFH